MVARKVESKVRTSPILMVVCVLAAVVVYIQVQTGPNLRVASLPVTASIAEPAPDLPTQPAFSMPPLESFSQIIDRPLFSVSRRPEEAVEVAPKAAQQGRAQAHGFIVKGIIIAENTRVALILRKGAKSMMQIAEGQVIDGWTVATILPDRVVFRRGNVSNEVKIEDLPGTGRKPDKKKRKPRRNDNRGTIGRRTKESETGQKRTISGRIGPLVSIRQG